MAKQNFLGLVKFTGSAADYVAQKTTGAGKLIFAEINSPDASKGKYIYANGLEYKVAESTDLDNLMQRVSTLESSMSTLEAWKSVVEGSISILDASVENHEGRIDTLESTAEALDERITDVSQDVINISTYVHETVDASIEDISTRLSNVGITAADNKLSVNGKDVALTGSDYVTVTAADNSVNVSLNAEKIQDAGSAEGHEKLATKGYVDEQMGELTQALVFKGSVSDKLPLPTEGQKTGDTYVAASSMTSPKADAGDLFIWNGSSWTQVERNLDGAVTASAGLDSSKLVVGTGNQGVKTIDVTAEDLADAIANANSAIQGVKAADVQNEYVTINVADGDASTKELSASLTVVDTSDALAAVDATGKLVDAKAVKDLVSDVKVQATLNSSTPDYVVATASVDETGRIISASVGVKTATLADASNGVVGLAIAKDVYDELTAVEETLATANTAMSDAIGLNSDFSITWTEGLGISTDASIVKAIEEVAKKANEAKQSGVTSFGDKTGAISIDGGATANGSVNFTMDGSTLTGTVVGWGDLTDKVDINTANIDDISAYVHETVDASIDALQAKDAEIDSSIDRLDASVSALETELAKHTVKSIEGETGISERANDEYVAVSVTKDDEGKVTLDSSVQLAETVDLTSITGATAATATGLATDATVKDYVTYALAWDVIG